MQVVRLFLVLGLFAAANALECTEPEPHFGEPPADKIPEHLQEAFTRCGAIKVSRMFVDDSNKGQGTHYKYPRSDIDANVETSKRLLQLKKPSAIGKTGWIVEAIQYYREKLAESRVLVMGSTTPKIESLLIAAGVTDIVTVDYNRVSYEHPAIKTMVLPALKDRVARGDNGYAHGFDAVFSISSFDHDGLGRYGDPIWPDADLHAMDYVHELLAPNGLFFLTVPVGPDLVVWNLHRRYGRVRLPLLLEGWQDERRFYWMEERLVQDQSFTKSYEPIFVLREPDAAHQGEAESRAEL